MTHTITIIECRLTDGSYVYDVRFDEGDPIPAITERDAQLMAEHFTLAIKNHTNDDVRTVYREKVA